MCTIVGSCSTAMLFPSAMIPAARFPVPGCCKPMHPTMHPALQLPHLAGGAAVARRARAGVGIDAISAGPAILAGVGVAVIDVGLQEHQNSSHSPVFSGPISIRPSSSHLLQPGSAQTPLYAPSTAAALISAFIDMPKVSTHTALKHCQVRAPGRACTASQTVESRPCHSRTWQLLPE
jgi:hypothetical protein